MCPFTVYIYFTVIYSFWIIIFVFILFTEVTNTLTEVCSYLSFTRYKIHNYEESRQYGVDLSLEVCLNHDKCEFKTTLLNNATLTKPLCKWDSGFLIPGIYNFQR